MNKQYCFCCSGLLGVLVAMAIVHPFAAHAGSPTVSAGGDYAHAQDNTNQMWRSVAVKLAALQSELHGKTVRRHQMEVDVRAALAHARGKERKAHSATTELIQAAGTLRLKAAADDLVDLLDYRDETIFSRDFSPYTSCPAFGALILIGKPGSVSSLRKLDSMAAETTDLDNVTKTRIMMLLTIIHWVEGDDVTDFILSDRLAGSGSSVPLYAFAHEQYQLMKEQGQGIGEGKRSLSGRAYSLPPWP